MKKTRFLMCPPDHFQILYEINPWMSVKKKADQEAAAKQWKDYYGLLTGKLGAQVELLDPVRGIPDMVFTANAGIVKGKVYIRSNFRHRERAKEEPYFEKWFRRKGYTIKTMERPLCFEGEGDALLMDGELYTGYHFRSDAEAHDIVSGYLRVPYFALELRDKRFYHLDTCFAPLDARTALVYPEAFETYAQLVLEENVPDLIRVPEKEALRFACNAAVVGKNVVLPSGCPETVKALESREFKAHELDFSEFIKAGGAAKCLVLRLE